MNLPVFTIASVFLTLLTFADFALRPPYYGKQINFAIPGLGLLAGNNNLNGGQNLFGPRTTTRTVVRTVATVTQPAFRTCTMPIVAGLMPCAGRRRRDLEENNGPLPIEPSLSVTLNIGSTQISDPVEVVDFLEAHEPLPSVIGYPEQEITLQEEIPTTTIYSSRDILDEQDDSVINDAEATTTETPYSNYISYDNAENTTPQIVNDEMILNKKARVNFGSVTTTTTTISLTSVATTYATGMMATLSITYGGCSPTRFPVSGLACV